MASFFSPRRKDYHPQPKAALSEKRMAGRVCAAPVDSAARNVADSPVAGCQVPKVSTLKYGEAMAPRPGVITFEKGSPKACHFSLTQPPVGWTFQTEMNAALAVHPQTGRNLRLPAQLSPLATAAQVLRSLPAHRPALPSPRHFHSNASGSPCRMCRRPCGGS